MILDLDRTLAVLERTPPMLDAWLRGLPAEWLESREGPDTWSPREIVGHLVHGEETDWIPRVRILLEHGEERPFDPFDRFAQATRFAGTDLGTLLDLFARRRAESLSALRGLVPGSADLTRRGRHPALGPVTLGELLAAWVVHDLGHIAQAARVMAKQHVTEVGPSKAYLPVLTRS